MSVLNIAAVSGEEWDEQWAARATELNAIKIAAMGDDWKRWLAFVDMVKTRLPNYWVQDASRSLMGCCYAIVVEYSLMYEPSRAVVGCQSWLVPRMYWIFESWQGKEVAIQRRDVATQLAQMLEGEGLEPFPPEWASITLPEISVDAREPGATLADALFTWRRW